MFSGPGVVSESLIFTNDAITEADPMVMSNFGLLMIAVWCLAYFGAATAGTSIKWLAGAFAIEKLVYVIAWLLWLSNNNLMALYAKDLFTAMFFSIYGLSDLVFMLFFSWVFFSAQAEKKEAHR